MRLALNHQTAKLAGTIERHPARLRLALNHQTAKLRKRLHRPPGSLRLALNHQTAKLLPPFATQNSELRLALNHQTAKLLAFTTTQTGTLRLALNHQTAKLASDLRPWKQGLFSWSESLKTIMAASKEDKLIRILRRGFTFSSSVCSDVFVLLVGNLNEMNFAR